MLRTLRPPYRELNEARSPSVGMFLGVHSLYDLYELTSKESVTRIRFLWRLATGGQTPHDIGRFAVGRFAEPG